MMRLLFLLSVVGLALPVSGCFDPRKPTCAFSCRQQLCPEDYECGPDLVCHLKGSSPALCDIESQADAATDATGQ